MKRITFLTACIMLLTNINYAQTFEKDVFKTSSGDLTITFIGHGTLMMEFNGKVVHIDPVGNYADYSKLPKADLILITHEHGDHLDVNAIEKIRKESSVVLLTKACSEKYTKGQVIKNGDSGTFAGLQVEAVPAYNIKNERSPGYFLCLLQHKPFYR